MPARANALFLCLECGLACGDHPLSSCPSFFARLFWDQPAWLKSPPNVCVAEPSAPSDSGCGASASGSGERVLPAQAVAERKLADDWDSWDVVAEPGLDAAAANTADDQQFEDSFRAVAKPLTWTRKTLRKDGRTRTSKRVVPNILIPRKGAGWKGAGKQRAQL
jgi:hypothetical protein